MAYRSPMSSLSDLPDGQARRTWLVVGSAAAVLVIVATIVGLAGLARRGPAEVAALTPTPTPTPTPTALTRRKEFHPPTEPAAAAAKRLTKQLQTAAAQVAPGATFTEVKGAYVRRGRETLDEARGDCGDNT